VVAELERVMAKSKSSGNAYRPASPALGSSKRQPAQPSPKHAFRPASPTLAAREGQKPVPGQGKKR
jgi:hypothetical protein